MVVQLANEDHPGMQSPPLVETPTAKVGEHIKLLESRLDDLTKKFDALSVNAGNATVDQNSSGRSKEERKDGDKENDSSKAKETSPETEEVDEVIRCTPELNRLTWVQWRKLRVSEEEWEKKTDAQKKKEINRRKGKPQKFVIDVVADTGDLGFHTAADRQGPSRDNWIPGRIRINSEHIMDALNDITNLALPTPCQLLHPFKAIVDFIVPIRAYMKTLDDELEKAKASRDAVMQSNESIEKTRQDASTQPTTGNGLSEKAEGQDSKSKPTRSREEEEVDLAEERCLHYRCFLNLLDTNLAQELRIADSIRTATAKKIMFSHLWHLFPPGELILYQDPNRDQPPQVTQVLKVSGGRARLPTSSPYSFIYVERQFRSKFSPFTIDSFHLDFDGNKFRIVQGKYEIPRFSGEVPIRALKVFPTRFLLEPTRTKMMQSLLKRGQIFRSLATVDAAHREYHGMSLDPEKEEVDGRVIIDFKLAPPAPENATLDDDDSNSNNEGESKAKARTFGLKPLSQTDDSELIEMSGRTLDYTLYNDHLYDIDKTDKLFLKNRVLLSPSQEMSSDELMDDELRLLPGTANAYVLRSRKYCKCNISLIEPIKLNDQAFDQLVLPKGYQKLIRSLVDKHSHGARQVEKKTDPAPPLERSVSRSPDVDHTHQDTLSIVKGKGRGLIILLHGVPGVGKTSTAETIADATGRPLLAVTCGDIGENASEVEKNLEQIFTNSHRWGCVLLLDEAEVFLAKRGHEDLRRNAMVSVFLRILEYYSGILFLTTNRVGTIDEAFKSRIHVSLYYPPLNWPTSKQIWQVNLDRSKNQVDADEAAILRFAKNHYKKNDENTRWNGRQIYNAFKTAMALAQIENKNGIGSAPDTPATDTGMEVKKPKLLPDHFRQIARASRKFDEYLLDTQGESFAAINKQQRIRDDSFGRFDDAKPPPMLKRRPTRTKLELSDLPTTSEEDTDISEDLSTSEVDEESEVEEKKSSKKSKKKQTSKTSSSGGKKKKREEEEEEEEKKKKKKGNNSKGKKNKKQEPEELSDESS